MPRFAALLFSLSLSLAVPAHAQEVIVVRYTPPPTTALKPIPTARAAARPEDQAPSLIVAGAFTLGLSLVGLGAVIAESPHFEGGWPDSASAIFALSAPFSALSMITLAGGAGLAVGLDDAAVLAVGGAVELAIAAIVATSAIAIAPGIGAPWADSQAQARLSEILGFEALALGATGVMAIVLGAVTEPSPQSALAISPVLSPRHAGVSAHARF